MPRRTVGANSSFKLLTFRHAGRAAAWIPQQQVAEVADEIQRLFRRASQIQHFFEYHGVSD